jgi:hypothetical protein
MDFFDWQGAGGIHSGAMGDERNAGRRKKTRSHGMFCHGIGIRSSIFVDDATSVN